MVPCWRATVHESSRRENCRGRELLDSELSPKSPRFVRGGIPAVIPSNDPLPGDCGFGECGLKFEAHR